MNLLFIDKLFSAAVIRALCWMLVHSIWQSLVLAIIAGAVVMVTRKSSPALRYNILSALFFSYLSVVCITFFIYARQVPDSVDLPANTVSAGIAHNGDGAVQGITGDDPAKESFQAGFFDRLSLYFNEHASFIVTIWFIVFCALFVKMLANLAYIQRVRNYKCYQPSDYWKRRLEELAELVSIRSAVVLLESGLAKMPMVVGFLKPVIVIPAGLITNLPQDEIESILVHELAHIKRRDYFVNLVQVFAETVLFFNPAMLWVSSLIREEREACCDELAIQQLNNKSAYINALVSFQEYSLGEYASVRHALAFPGRKNHLLNRVRRIILNENKNLNFMEKITITVCVSLICAATLLSTNESFGRQTVSPRNEQTTAKDTVTPNGQAAQKGRSTEVKFPDPVSTEGADENYLNTVTTTDKDGTKYRLVLIGDQLPRFYVNDEMVPRKKMDKYADLITRLSSELFDRQKIDAERKMNEAETKGKYHDQYIVDIVNDLVKDKIIADKASLSTFRLTTNEFSVNGQKQSFEVFNQYKGKYIKSVDDVYKFNSPSK